MLFKKIWVLVFSFMYLVSVDPMDWSKDTIFGVAQTKLGPSYFVAALVIPYKAKAEGLKQGAISFKEEVKQCARKHRIIDFKGLKLYQLSISIAFNILS